MAYFDDFPKVSLLSFSDNRSSSSDYVESTNIFKRGKIRDDIFQVAAAFDKFSIRGDDRPDNVADELYGNPEYDWIILISNNILNIRDEWPMSEIDFQRYITTTILLSNLLRFITTKVWSVVILRGNSCSKVVSWLMEMPRSLTHTEASTTLIQELNQSVTWSMRLAKMMRNGTSSLSSQCTSIPLSKT